MLISPLCFSSEKRACSDVNHRYRLLICFIATVRTTGEGKSVSLFVVAWVMAARDRHRRRSINGGGSTFPSGIRTKIVIDAILIFPISQFSQCGKARMHCNFGKTPTHTFRRRHNTTTTRLNCWVLCKMTWCRVRVKVISLSHTVNALGDSTPLISLSLTFLINVLVTHASFVSRSRDKNCLQTKLIF